MVVALQPRPGATARDAVLRRADAAGGRPRRGRGGAVVGYVRIGAPTSVASNRHVVAITGLAVDPGRRGEGIGRALVDAAAREAAARGARRLTLRVLGPNAAARGLYERAGFVVEGVLRDEFHLDGRYVDDVLMARDLTPSEGAR